MITCKNCGADYDENTERCPYCGGDNFEKSVRTHQEKISGLHQEKKRWEAMPDKVAQKMVSLTMKIVICAVIGVVLVCILLFAGTRIKNSVMNKMDAAAIEKLEEMYQNGDYTGISKYMDKLGNPTRPKYEKYNQIVILEELLSHIQKEDEGYLQFLVRENEVPTNITYIVWILKECQFYENEYYKYDEQDVVEAYRKWCYDFMEEQYGLPREEAEGVFEAAGEVNWDNEDEVRKDLEQRALAHLKEK
ncbi:MAG: hypothetical protein MR355_04360 [Lachnospiraceae bacterium]|nr:hypothetical protein [Lachnospiraceae bacterium]